MQTRFATIAVILTAAAGCAHRETLPETTAAPTYRHEDLLEAAALGSHGNLDERVAILESQMKAVRIEVGRVSGVTQRLEARQLQTVGVTPEPKSKAATPLGKTAQKEAGQKSPKSADKTTDKPAASAAPADPRDPWAAPATPPAAPQAAEAAHAPDSKAPQKDEKVASATPAPEAAHESETAHKPEPAHEPAAPSAPASAPDSVGFGLQLAAFGSAARAASGWEELKSRGGPLLADLLPKREETSQGGKTLFRLKAGPLPDRETAAKRCDALKAQGMSCLVTPFSGDWPSS